MNAETAVASHDPDLMTVQEAAERLGIRAGTVRVLVHTGRIPSVGMTSHGRLTLVRSADVERYAAQRERRNRGMSREPARRALASPHALDALDAEESRLVRAYAEGKTLSELASWYDLSREGVRQRLLRALERAGA